MNPMNEEEYLLACVAEECAELIQRVTKAQRFGLEEIQVSNPDETRTNRQRIVYEACDLKSVLKRLEGLHPDYTRTDIVDDRLRKVNKQEKLTKYMGYSASLGWLKV